MPRFRGDPDLPILLSLEQDDAENRRASKAAIFRERTVQARRLIPEIKNPQDALLVTLGERGTVDLDYLSGLLHQRPAEFLPDLKGTVFLNPQTRRWETEDEYLSGNVRTLAFGWGGLPWQLVAIVAPSAGLASVVAPDAPAQGRPVDWTMRFRPPHRKRRTPSGFGVCHSTFTLPRTGTQSSCVA